ncbi:MAG TPA: helix-turn-helix domain-containing protein [Nocardioidaceae bacterium]|nr:helix-turn-helix domain-containing protein [Nocardioidaceae bacterium]
MTVNPARVDRTVEPTLHRLLQERLLRGSRVLSGEAKLARPVRWCHSLQDVLRDQSTDLDGIVVLADATEMDDQRWVDLMGRSCSAIFVRGDTDVPFSIRKHTLDQPVVVALPESVSRTAVLELVAVVSLAHRAHVLEYGQQVHSTLAHLLHRGAGLTALCSRLARLSHCAVGVLGTDLHLLAFDPGRGRQLEPAAVTSALRGSRQQMLTMADSSGGRHGVATLELTVKGVPVTCVAGAIDLLEQRDGWVVLLDASESITEHDLAEHRVAVQQAVTIMGTELLRVRGIERAEERAKGNFVHALLHARFTNHADLVARASHYGFDVHGRYGVVVAHSGGLLAQRDSPSKLAEMAREAGRVLESPGRQTLTTVVSDVVAVIRQVSPSRRGQQDQAEQELREYAAALERRLGERGPQPVQVAFGRPEVGADAIVESYREARIALELRGRLGVSEVCGFSDLRVHSVLLELAQQPAGGEYAEEILGPLREDRDGSLAEVARVYVEAGSNLNEAARRLNVHRNTMLYKLERITRLLRRDMREPDVAFAVWLAIRLNDLAETTKRVNRDLMSG